MNKLFLLIFIASLTVGGYFAWEKIPAFRNIVEKNIPLGEFRTLEIRFSAEEILHKHKDALVKDGNYTLLKPDLLFFPYLLMEVKYSKPNCSTGEGILLWGLDDGEMVLDTQTWEKSHGFQDCLLSKVNKNDFYILRTIIETGGSIDKERLYQKFKGDPKLIDKWVESCGKKKLVASYAQKLRLHFENPKLEVKPVTKLNQSIVAQPSKNTLRIGRTYSTFQIKKLTHTVFGKDFCIRKSQKIYLPVYRFSVQNPDGSIFISYWNALNASRMPG